MKVARWIGFVVLGLGVTCVYAQQYAPVFTPPPQGVMIDPSNAQVLTNITYPQIVRVSYVQGDVRVSRGEAGKKQDGSEWQQAEVDLPMEAGFSLVTGADGRAEVEFEDASMVYLAENSVLVFNQLSSKNGVPQTELGLLSGMLTMAVQPMAAGEWFAVRTPTDRLSVRYPDKAFLRVNSYLDAISLTAESDTLLRVDRSAVTQTDRGDTKMFRSGIRQFSDKPVDQTQFAQWDGWVAGQLLDRNEALATTMKQAGLKEALPGLAQMKGEGSFYACAPYGTCWEPKDGWAGQEAQAGAVTQQAATPSLATSGAATGKQTKSQTVNSAGTINPFAYVDFFPCSPFRVRNPLVWDPVLMMYVPRTRLLNAAYPYEWTVCHMGSWIRHEHRFVWVVGRKRHHHPPVRWVKSGGKVGFVPLHPRDVAGRPPLNLKDGIYRPIDKKTGALEHVAYTGDKSFKVLDEAPRNLHIDDLPKLARAEAPRAEARSVKAGTPPAPVLFDHKSQSFMVARTIEQPGGGAKSVMEPIGGRGGALQGQARGGSVEAARGSSVGGSSGGVSRGANGGASSSGGGVSHASSAPASAPSASAPAAAASAPAAASSGGGKPH